MGPNKEIEGRSMRIIAIGMLASVLLSGCGTATGDRGLSGAGIGAGIGIIGGPPGMVVGGVVGAAAGMLSKPKQVDLGKPAWR
jgi:hypothetical protein